MFYWANRGGRARSRRAKICGAAGNRWESKKKVIKGFNVYHDAIVVIYTVISCIACSFEDKNMTYMGRAAERGGVQIAPDPEVLGAPQKFLLGPSLSCVLNISAQRTRYLFFALSTEIWHKK
jgi:hypothetical protein